MKNYISKAIITLSLIISLVSCAEKNKSDLFTDGKTVKVEFNASEESNMSNYDIEVSPDGKNYSTFETLQAVNKPESKYEKLVNVEEIFKQSDKINIRIKMVDKDGKSEYYPQTYWVNRP